MKKYQLNCPYCGAPAVCRPASMVYGSSVKTKGSYLYHCSNWPVCDSYVAAHKRDRRPMGTLANGRLRHQRILAHRALDDFRRSRHMEKWAAYVWLQGKLGLSAEQTHIGQFSEKECGQVIALCRQSRKANRARSA